MTRKHKNLLNKAAAAALPHNEDCSNLQSLLKLSMTIHSSFSIVARKTVSHLKEQGDLTENSHF